MTVKHNAEFERAVRIEMLRARAAIERSTIAKHAGGLVDSLDPRVAVGRLLPGNLQGVVSRSLRLVTRYPYILTTVLSNRRFKAVRWISVAALAVGAWAMFSGNNKPDDPDEGVA
ncbi:MAG: hypothetical protein LRY53_03550 [Burkholderiaceae bacterium]|nr:hypothetical protein [Burkholderiaceae bacterium]MCD8517726.1 hypothetical protein [Burkholderiaceae bacterium]MCD8536017.1 hypothetical protein [Burkholderiaceae bacterium]MCD8564721.1 hypothetical protein [Burkholderiaceae bacterium]